MSDQLVGICGDTMTGILGGSLYICDLPAGHAGWHGTDSGAAGEPSDMRTSWSNEAMEVAALRQQLDEARGEIERINGLRITRDTSGGCCKAAVDSDGHAHDHVEWYCDLVATEADRDRLRAELDETRGGLERVKAIAAKAVQAGEARIEEISNGLLAAHVELTEIEVDRDRLLVVYRAAERLDAFLDTKIGMLPAGTLTILYELRAAIRSAAPAEPAPYPDIGSASTEALRLIDAATGGGIRSQDFSVPVEDEDDDQ